MIDRPIVQFDWGAFGRDLRATMAERHASVRVVARNASVGHATVSRAARDLAVTVETMFSLCEWMGVDAEHYCRRRR